MKCNLFKPLAALAFVTILFAFVPFENSSGVFSFGSYYSEPLARLFQLLFILFIISPPLIVVMLYLIWKELKEKNKIK